MMRSWHWKKLLSLLSKAIPVATNLIGLLMKNNQLGHFTEWLMVIIQSLSYHFPLIFMLINAANLAVKDFAAKKSPRPIIQGVFITPDVTVATDSYSLLEVANPMVDEKELPTNLQGHIKESFVLELDDAVRIQKNLSTVPETKILPILSNIAFCSSEEGKTARIGLSMQTGVKTLQGEFPDYQSLFPINDASYLQIRLNADYLYKMAAYFKKYAKDKTITISMKDSSNPLIFTGETEENSQNIRGIIMPMRSL